MMKRVLWALLTVSVVFLAVGMFSNTAIAGDFQGLEQQQQRAAAEQQILPPANAGWGQRAIGVAPHPTELLQEVKTYVEEERGDSSYSSSSSDSDD